MNGESDSNRGRHRHREQVGLSVPESIALDTRLYPSLCRSITPPLEQQISRESLRETARSKRASRTRMKAGKGSKSQSEDGMPPIVQLTSPRRGYVGPYSAAPSKDNQGPPPPPHKGFSSLWPVNLLSGAKKDLLGTIQHHSIAALASNLPPCCDGEPWMALNNNIVLEPTHTEEVRLRPGGHVVQVLKDLRALVGALAFKLTGSNEQVAVTLTLSRIYDRRERVKRGVTKDVKAREFLWETKFSLSTVQKSHLRYVTVPETHSAEGVGEVAEDGTPLFRLKLRFVTQSSLRLPLVALVRRAHSRHIVAKPPLVKSQMLVYSVTWNVDGSWPPDTVPPLYIDKLLEEGRDSHVIVVGLQEVGFSASSIMNESGSNGERWATAIQEALATAGDAFSLLSTYGLSGLWMGVFVRRRLAPFVSNVKVHRSMVGLSAKGNSKGAVSMTFMVCQTRFCFIVAHLSAFHMQEMAEKRHEEFRGICNSLVSATGRTIYDYDLTVFLGDLNYRINHSNDKVRRFIQLNAIDRLLEADQLLIAVSSGLSFEGFLEAPITFLPTFKFDIASDQYDTSKKQRIPSYCDRVLWHGDAGCRSLSYRSYPFTNSDHRPVSSLLKVPLLDYDEGEEPKAPVDPRIESRRRARPGSKSGSKGSLAPTLSAVSSRRTASAGQPSNRAPSTELPNGRAPSPELPNGRAPSTELPNGRAPPAELS